MDTTTTQNKTLLSLPGEIRNQIWESVLRIKTPLGVLAPILLPPSEDEDNLCSSRPTLLKFKEPSATKTSQSLRSEVLSIFYSTNDFWIGRIPLRKSQRENDFSREQYLRALKRWRGEEGVSFLRRLEVTVVLCVRDGSGSQRADGLEEEDCGFDRFCTFSGRVERGRVVMGLRGVEREFCCCGFGSEGKDGEELAENVDGRCLIDAVIDLCEKLAPVVREEESCCEGCGNSKLVRS